MNEMDFEAQVRSIASRMEYPPTPDLAGNVTARLQLLARPRLISKAFVWSLTIIIVLCSSLMLIPSVRAAILEFIQIGTVRIFSPEPTDQSTTTATSQAQTAITSTSPASDVLSSLDQMAGQTTLAEAQANVEYPILLPLYPTDLGEPDHVYIQEMNGNALILVWMDPQDQEQVLMSLHFIPNGSWAIKKMEPTVIEETTVHGDRAIWTTGPYPLITNSGNIQYMRLINGHVLIWAASDVTYRLETNVSLEEAVQIAESLAQIP